MRTNIVGVFGLCPACGKCKCLTKHHIYPKRFFGGGGPILFICRYCHDKIERDIPQYIKLTKERYIEKVNDFLTEVRYVQTRRGSQATM